MVYNWNDPKSIVSWYMVWPERHGPELRWTAELFPQWRLAIRDAWVLINEAEARGWVRTHDGLGLTARSALGSRRVSPLEEEWSPVEEADLEEGAEAH